MLINIDMHVHTVCSDGNLTARQVVEEGKRRGLHGVAVSDHNTFLGSREALELSDSDFLIVPSAEYSTTRGHMLAFFVRADARESGVFCKEGLFDFEEIRHFTLENDGMLFMAHPFRGRAPDDALLKRLSGVEVFNGRNTSERADWNISAVRLCRDRGMPFSAGSDAHARGEIARAYRVFDFPHDRLCTLDELKEMLGEPHGRYYGSYTPYTLQGISTLYFSFRKKAPRRAAKGAAKIAAGLFKDAVFMSKRKNARLAGGCMFDI